VESTEVETLPEKATGVRRAGLVKSKAPSYEVQMLFKEEVVFGFAPPIKNIVSSCVITELTYRPIPFVYVEVNEGS
jgi:hypothetical protein